MPARATFERKARTAFVLAWNVKVVHLLIFPIWHRAVITSLTIVCFFRFNSLLYSFPSFSKYRACVSDYFFLFGYLFVSLCFSLCVWPCLPLCNSVLVPLIARPSVCLCLSRLVPVSVCPCPSLCLPVALCLSVFPTVCVCFSVSVCFSVGLIVGRSLHSAFLCRSVCLFLLFSAFSHFDGWL